jgi:hypothetical protein
VQPAEIQLTSEARINRAQSATWREVDGQVVIISVDSARVRLLNGVGGFVWARCDGRALASIAEEVGRAYDVNPEVARDDVERFVRDLAARGMIVVEA